MRFFVLTIFFLLSSTVLAHQKVSHEYKLSRDRYIASGIIGSVTGFGIGHLIQDRYKGFAVYFFVDSISLGGILEGMLKNRECNKEYDGHGDDECKESINAFMLAALIASRIWQITSLWKLLPQNYRIVSKKDLYIGPILARHNGKIKALPLGFQMSF